MMITQTAPQFFLLKTTASFLTEDIYDFWRPNYSQYPVVDGPLSNSTYIESFQKVWNRYKETTGRTLADYDALTFHIPYKKWGKALQSVIEETMRQRKNV